MSGRKLILKSYLSPGDIVMLTAAVRELHTAYPGEYLTDVRTPCPQLWENNPWIAPLADDDPDAHTIDCHYPLINQSNFGPYHFVHGYTSFLAETLGRPLRPTLTHGDLHVSQLEKSWYSQVREIAGEEIPFWIVVAGGKWDYTIKWWDHHRFQRVVEHFRGRILFVQVGEQAHHHPPLRGVLDLRAKTDLRQLVRLVYHAQGVLCPVTLMMHLAAAVEVRPGRPKNRPCVVVAGGREPAQWEAYPHHQYIHTNGALRCCDQGGCWKARTEPLGDGDEKDQPQHLCMQTVRRTDPGNGAPAQGGSSREYLLPRCMDMITAEEVIRRIELYFTGGACRYLTPAQARIARTALERSEDRRIDSPRIALTFA